MSPHRYTLLGLRLVVGAGFLVHRFAKWQRGPEKFSRLAFLHIPAPLAAAWTVTRPALRSTSSIPSTVTTSELRAKTICWFSTCPTARPGVRRAGEWRPRIVLQNAPWPE